MPTVEYETYTFTGQGPNPVKVLSRRPGRVSLLVFTEPPSGSFTVSFVGQLSEQGISPASGTNAVLLTSHSLPALIDSDWYVWAGLLTTVHVTEIWTQ